MTHLDDSYEFAAFLPEERARIAIQQLEQMERNFFDAQVSFSMREAELHGDEAGLADLEEEKHRILSEYRERLAVAKAIFEETRIDPEPAQSARKRSAKK